MKQRRRGWRAFASGWLGWTPLLLLAAIPLSAQERPEDRPHYNQNRPLQERFEAGLRELEDQRATDLRALTEAHRNAAASDRPELERKIRDRKIRHHRDVLSLQLSELGFSKKIGEIDETESEAELRLKQAVEQTAETTTQEVQR